MAKVRGEGEGITERLARRGYGMRTVYVRDTALWDVAARRAAGEGRSLSEVIGSLLARWVEAKDRQTKGGK